MHFYTLFVIAIKQNVLKASFFVISVCTDSMIYMDLCTQWKAMCQSSKFLQEKCPRTCEKCKPGELLYKNLVNADANLTNCYEGYVLLFVIIEFQFIANGVNLVTTRSALSRVEEDSKQEAGLRKLQQRMVEMLAKDQLSNQQSAIPSLALVEYIKLHKGGILVTNLLYIYIPDPLTNVIFSFCS